MTRKVTHKTHIFINDNEIYHSAICHIYVDDDNQYYLVINKPKQVIRYYDDFDSCISKAIALSRELQPIEIKKN
jgi:hypothetical protein